MSGILIRAIYAVILPITDVCFEDTLRIVTFEKACLTIHLQQQKKYKLQSDIEKLVRKMKWAI
jgi:hypothetical protein